MIERVSASALTPSTRVKVEDLTPMERESLTDHGQIGPDGFLDIEKPAPPPLVDFRAEARRVAVTQLKSVAEQGGKKPEVIPAAVEARARQEAETQSAQAIKELATEIENLQVKLASRSPCPRCGLGLHESCEVVPSATDTEEFLKCVLSGTQFEKSHKLFGGRLTVVLTTRDGAVDDLVRRAVTDALRAKEVISETEVFALMRHLTTAAALRRYVSKDVDIAFPDLPSGDPAEFRGAAMARMAKIPAQIQNSLRPVLTDFHALVDVLTARAGDSNFWEGTPA